MLRLLSGRESQVMFDCNGLVRDGRSNEISESGLTAKSTMKAVSPSDLHQNQ